MPKPPPSNTRIAIEGLVIILACLAVTVALGFVWMERYTARTGIDAGNAPPFFGCFGLLIGFIVASLYGYWRMRKTK